MLKRLFEESEPLGAALATLTTDLTPFTSEEYQAMHQWLGILRPFHEATVKLSRGKLLSASKVIPLVKMLKHYAARKCGRTPHPIGENLATNLTNNLNEKFAVLEKATALSLATLLDPRLKELGFCNQGNAEIAVERLIQDCAAIMHANLSV